MNVGALLIFGKMLSWIFLVIFTLLTIIGFSGVYEHNRDKVSVILHGTASLKWKVVLFYMFMIILSLGFIVATWGVS